MAETSFPIVEKNLNAAQWQSIMSAFGHGVLDYGGFPYRVTNVNDVTDQVTIGVDSIRGKNEAVVAGFGHSIDSPKVLTLPAVATTTVYEIGLLYDPTQHTAAGGPVKLTVLTAPVDVTEGRVWIVLYRVTRQPSQALSAATRVENRQRVSPQIVVTGTADLPPTSAVLVDTVARVRVTGERWAAAIDGNGVVSWQKVDGGTNPDLAAATHLAEPGTLARRASNGGLRIVTGSHEDDAVSRKYLWENASGSATSSAAGKLVLRGADSNFLVPQPTHPSHPATKSYVDDKGVPSHKHPGSDITTRLPYEHVDGSRAAYDNVQSGQVYTVSVNSTGDFMRFSSRRQDKDEIEPLLIDPRKLLAPVPVQYRRRHHETHEVPDGARVEWGFIADDELAREDGAPELVLTEPDEDGVQRAESWDNAGLTAAHHRLLQWLTARADAVDRHLGINTEGVQA